MISLKVKTTRTGYHKWPKAPNHRAYLRDLHRHDFIVIVEMAVGKINRQIELHDLRDVVNVIPFCANHSLTLEDSEKWQARSCEEMAQAIVDELFTTYQAEDGVSFISAEVWEDEFHGARATWGRA